MMTKNIKKSVKEIFKTHMKTFNKCNRKDTDSDSDSKHEYYPMEDVGVDLEDINASKTIALSDLHRPQKCQKINHLTPMIIVLIKTWLEKSRFKKIRILLDSRSSGSTILEKFVHRYHHQLDYERRKLSKIQKVQNHIHFKRFFKNKSIEWNLHVDSTPGPHQYDMILGRNIMSELGIMLDFKDQTMTQLSI